MRIRHILLLCSAVALPQLATADLSVTNPAGLGQVHALLDFCSQTDPQNSASFQAEWQSIVGGQASLLAQIEQSAAYQQQYAEFTAELQKLPKGQTHTVCTVSAAAWNGSTGRGGEHGRDDQHQKPSTGSDPAQRPAHEADR